MRFDFYGHFKQKRQQKYVVKKGDTLYKIAKENNTTVAELLEANNLESALIYPEQVLLIPKKMDQGANYFIEYVVKPDDTLELIAKKNNTTIEALSEYNDIGKIYLVTDQVLTIPMSYEIYEVQANDTLQSIVDQSHMTLEEFMNANFKNLLPEGTKVYVK